MEPTQSFTRGVVAPVTIAMDPSSVMSMFGMAMEGFPVTEGRLTSDRSADPITAVFRIPGRVFDLPGIASVKLEVAAVAQPGNPDATDFSITAEAALAPTGSAVAKAAATEAMSELAAALAGQFAAELNAW